MSKQINDVVERREREILEFVAQGASLVRAAESAHVSVGLVDRLVRRQQTHRPHGDELIQAPDSAWKPSPRAAELIRERGLVLSPNPPRCSERDAAILNAAFADLWCFQAIADQHGITRERVRQIVLAHTGLRAADVIAARAAQTEADHNELLRGIVWHYVVTDPEGHTSFDQISTETSIPTSLLRHLLPIQQQRLRCAGVTAGGRRAHDLSDEAIYDELRRVAALCAPTPIVASFYDHHRTPGYPGEQVLTKRFGTWRGACLAAGVLSVPPPPRTAPYEHRWTLEELTNAVDDYLLAHAHTPISAQRMAVWLREHPNPYPSAGIIRDRLGRFSHVVAERTRNLITQGRINAAA